MILTRPIVLVVPVRDEIENLPRLLEDVAVQTRRPDTVVIVDAGSTDGSVEFLTEAARRDPRISFVSAPGARPGRGRNVGAESVEGFASVLIFTDAGIALPPTFVEALSNPILADAAEATLGGYVTDGRSDFDACVELLTCCESELINGRGVYAPTTAALGLRAETFRDLGGFPDHLPAFEDALFFARLASAGTRTRRARDLIVTWSMGRGIKNLVYKARRNGRGEAQAGIISRRTVFVLGLLVMLITTLVAPVPWAAKAAVVAALVWWRFRRLRHKNPPHYAALVKRPGALLRLGPATLLADLAHLFGYGLGLFDQGPRLRIPVLFRPVRGLRPEGEPT